MTYYTLELKHVFDLSIKCCCVADSIVIGFWVGLAVFVIFMFFVLTLLTKTGAPNPE